MSDHMESNEGVTVRLITPEWYWGMPAIDYPKKDYKYLSAMELTASMRMQAWKERYNKAHKFER